MSKYKTIYLDVNVFLDFICKLRSANDKENARSIFTLIYSKQIKACTNISTLAFAKSFLRKEHSEKQAKEIIVETVRLLEMTTTNQKITDEALASNFLDWEDALHYYSALHYGVDCIVTRNVKDFKHSKIPILTPEHFIQNYLNNL
ncbi:MAG: hypothetical protein RJA07_291 [Bacteroidota bacterium]|jgi:predicted nucleic acid-binding protein